MKIRNEVQKISGDVTIDGSIAGASTEAKQDAAIALEGVTGSASDVDGTRAAQLRYIGEAAEAARALLATIDADTSKITTCDTDDVVVSNFPPTQQVAAISWPLPGGAATAANQANISANTLSSATSLIDVKNNQTDGSQSSMFVDEAGTPYGVKHTDNKPRVSSTPYTYDIAKGNISGHSALFKIGYNPSVTTTEEDLWSAGGTYVWPDAEMQMEVVSSDNTQDIGTVIKGDATGDTVVSDADPIDPLTHLSDDDVDFTAATAVAVGDCVIINPHSKDPLPEWGYVTAVAAHTLTIANGMSNGGSLASVPYAIIDQSANTGAQVVGFFYLDSDYNQYGELVVLNGTTAVPTVNTDLFRINSFAVVAAGSGCKPVGNLSIRHLANTPIYSHITAGYSISRQLIYTVPAGYTGYMTGGTISASNPNDSKVQTARVIMRTDENPDFEFLTGCIFYPKAEIVVCNETVPIHFESPIKVIEKSDFIVSGQGFTGFAGPITAVFRGWLEEN